VRETDSHIVSAACVDLTTSADPVNELATSLPDKEYAFIILLVSPEGNLEQIAKDLRSRVRTEQIIGARTAGEICNRGYSNSKIVALAFPATHFVAEAWLVESLLDVSMEDVSRQVLNMRQQARTRAAGFDNEFAFLLVDGLSRKEDSLLAKVSAALGSMQLFGGSSGDGLNFEHAPILYNGKVYEDAAILMVVRSNCAVRVFREDHFERSDLRLVVTGAVPEQRLVTEINAEPAAPEYARLVGIDPQQLSPFIFASHPIVVSVGDQHHVRAIQKVENNRHLRFFSSIDEGMVLTVADAKGISTHLQQVLTGLYAQEEPDMIFACDCILRRLEAEQKGELEVMSRMLSEHRVFGFSTYGEQFNALHVNQTLTGLAIYPPSTLST